jgi:hypothetical protein
MARTAADIRAELETQYPTIREQHGTTVVDLDPADEATAAEYAERLDAWAERMALDETLADDAAVGKTRRAQIVTALAQMNAARDKLSVGPADRTGFADLPPWGTATAAQRLQIVRVSLDEALQDIAGVIHIMQDLRQIEETEESS